MKQYAPRTCVVCGAVASWRWRPGKVVMLSLSVIIFRRDAKRRQLKAAPAIHVCEGCMLEVAHKKQTTMESELLSEAVLNRIRDRYNSMKAEKHG